MTTTLCTFPGKNGDLLWALPTVRAISRRLGAPVDLLLAAELEAIVPLLQQQPYLGDVRSAPEWTTQDTAPRSPRTPSPIALNVLGKTYAHILHLGYRDWPTPDVVLHTLHTANLAWQDVQPGDLFNEVDLALDEPWITVPRNPDPEGVTIGFTDEHFELKYGVTRLIRQTLNHRSFIVGRNARWGHEGNTPGLSWQQSAARMAGSQAFLGCCSALHVLAVALGTPVVLMEPNPHRHNPVFYPLGDRGPQVTLVRGTDGLPTFDARHVYDTLSSVLSRRF